MNVGIIGENRGFTTRGWPIYRARRYYMKAGTAEGHRFIALHPRPKDIDHINDIRSSPDKYHDELRFMTFVVDPYEPDLDVLWIDSMTIASEIDIELVVNLVKHHRSRGTLVVVGQSDMPYHLNKWNFVRDFVVKEKWFNRMVDLFFTREREFHTDYDQRRVWVPYPYDRSEDFVIRPIGLKEYFFRFYGLIIRRDYLLKYIPMLADVDTHGLKIGMNGAKSLKYLNDHPSGKFEIHNSGLFTSYSNLINYLASSVVVMHAGSWACVKNGEVPPYHTIRLLEGLSSGSIVLTPPFVDDDMFDHRYVIRNESDWVETMNYISSEMTTEEYKSVVSSLRIKMNERYNYEDHYHRVFDPIFGAIEPVLEEEVVVEGSRVVEPVDR